MPRSALDRAQDEWETLPDEPECDEDGEWDGALPDDGDEG